jgi:signal transduction histidine kinase
MAPVLLGLIAVVGVSAPTAYHLVRVGEIRERGDLLAADLGLRLGVEARARPRLWAYDSAKVLDHLRGFRLQEDLRAVQVYDDAGRVLARRTLGGDDAGPRIWSRAPIGAGGAEVWVAMSVAHSRRVAALLSIPFVLLGLALAAALHVLPRRALRRAERRIEQLIAELQASRTRLAARGVELEEQVAERVRDLRQAYDELRDRDERLRALSGRAVALQEADRRAIARDLHDSAGQTLTAVRLNLQLLEQLADSPERVRTQVGATLAQVDAVMEEIRRAVFALGPALVHEVGLAEALRRHCQVLAEQAGIQIACEVSDAIGATGAAVEGVCYRLVQEALTNVVRHAQATHASVRIDRVASAEGAQLRLRVHDDGGGFAAGEAERGRGLRGMQERLELLGGELSIDSTPGGGTTLLATLPLESPRLEGPKGPRAGALHA